MHLLSIPNGSNSWVRENDCRDGVVVRLGLGHVVEQPRCIEMLMGRNNKSSVVRMQGGVSVAPVCESPAGCDRHWRELDFAAYIAESVHSLRCGVLILVNAAAHRQDA